MGNTVQGDCLYWVQKGRTVVLPRCRRNAPEVREPGCIGRYCIAGDAGEMLAFRIGQDVKSAPNFLVWNR